MRRPKSETPPEAKTETSFGHLQGVQHVFVTIYRAFTVQVLKLSDVIWVFIS